MAKSKTFQKKSSSAGFLWGKVNDIFAFDNYRRIIRSYIKERKTKDREFSLNVFAKETGHKSRGFFTNAITGKRNASTASILAIARVMGLNKKETRYFVNLANLERAENIEVRMFYAGEVQRDIKKIK